MITIPYIHSLKQNNPHAEIHFLTRKEVSGVFKRLGFIDHVIELGGGRNLKWQLIWLVLKLPWLLLQRYDVVIDLQNHRMSRWLRIMLFPQAWSEFDKYSPVSAGERTRLTIDVLKLGKIICSIGFPFNNPDLTRLLDWPTCRNRELILLNPAGFSPSRNWPLENYVDFARLWLKNKNPDALFLLLLMPAHAGRASVIKRGLGESCIDFTGKTNQSEAFSIMKHISLAITEDSGLMHMAWIQQVPTLALFSSSRKDWSGPLGKWSVCLDSSDLECGPCMKEICPYKDNRCLTRYTPKLVYEKAIFLTDSLRHAERV